jgi:hypothetical protein
MKQVIAGKLYDTETAEHIAKDSFGNHGDFKHWEESLCRTAKGAYFLAGSGGAMTRYATDLGNNSRGGGYEIVPLTEAEALQWCEDRKINPDVISDYFKIEDA